MPARTAAFGLGRRFDIMPAVIPVDLEAGAKTGFRLHLRNYAGVTIVLFAGIGTANDDLQCTIRESNAATGGTVQDLVNITSYWIKDALVLDGTQAWAKVTQTISASIADTGGAGTSAEHSQLVAFDIHQGQLSDGFEWIQVNIPDLGAAGAKLGCAFYIMWDLAVQRTPENLAQPNA